MTFQKSVKMLLASSVLALTGCCMDDMSCGGSNTYVPVSSCHTCSSPMRSTCGSPCGSTCSVKSRCQNPCAVCGYDGSYAYTSWY